MQTPTRTRFPLFADKPLREVKTKKRRRASYDARFGPSSLAR